MYSLLLCYICRPYWRCYYSNTDAIIYVVDSADKDRIGISKEELFQMLRVSKNSILHSKQFNVLYLLIVKKNVRFHYSMKILFYLL